MTDPRRYQYPSYSSTYKSYPPAPYPQHFHPSYQVPHYDMYSQYNQQSQVYVPPHTISYNGHTYHLHNDIQHHHHDDVYTTTTRSNQVESNNMISLPSSINSEGNLTTYQLVPVSQSTNITSEVVSPVTTNRGTNTATVRVIRQ